MAPDPKAPKTFPRPLSPHLQIYKPQLTSVLSISHRLTGIALFIGLFVLIAWLYALAFDGAMFDCLQDILTSFLGRMALLGWTFCLFYHLCNGVRHLLWDAGYGFEIRTAYATGWLVVFGSVGLTLFCWYIAYGERGREFWMGI